MSFHSALESLTIHDHLFFMALCLTFGGSVCPNLWNCTSESGTDLTNKLIQNPFWDHTKFFDPLSSQLDSPESLPSDIPLLKLKNC
jgi:hypothetical protein